VGSGFSMSADARDLVAAYPTRCAQPKKETVQRAMEILKDRPMPRPKAELRHNFIPGARSGSKSR
jgi:hypothetical protein